MDPGRSGYDSMFAWNRNMFEFNDSIQSRGNIWRGAMPFNSKPGRTISRDDYTPPSPPPASTQIPSFTQAKSQWSPPPSPRTRSLRNSPTTSPPRSPVDSARSAHSSTSSPILTPKSRAEQRSLAEKLYAASCAGDTKHILLLLSLDAEINTPALVENLYDAFKPAKPGCLSALAGAAGHGQLDAVALLLSQGAALNPTMKESSSSPLHQACKADDAEMAAYLLNQGADVDSLNCFNTTPLMYASKYGSPPLVAVILSHQPDLHKLSFINTAAIHWALWQREQRDPVASLEVVELLLSAGADPNQTMGDGGAALHCVALVGGVEMARLLVRFGAEVGLRNGEWKTAGMVARECGHLGLAGVLGEVEVGM